MSTVVLVLMIMSVALAAYAKGRREGTWSWPLFLKAVLGIWVLGAGAGFLGIWLGRRMGPEHALLVTGMTVLVIVAGVVALALWMRRKVIHSKL